MYCVKCGVELRDSEKCCPLCQTPVFHPDIERPQGEKPYPEYNYVDKSYNRRALMVVLSVVCGLISVITLLIDLRISGSMGWSGYVMGGIIVGYTAFILPWWFKRPNPVIIIPLVFGATMLLLLYISLSTKGGWFLSFAFPVTGVAGLMLTAVVALTKYLKKGYLFIYGGTIIAIGGFTVLIEMFTWVTFHVRFLFWSLYPLICCVTIGIMLIVIGCCKPMRESLRKKFFI